MALRDLKQLTAQGLLIGRSVTTVLDAPVIDPLKKDRSDRPWCKVCHPGFDSCWSIIIPVSAADKEASVHCMKANGEIVVEGAAPTRILNFFMEFEFG